MNNYIRASFRYWAAFFFKYRLNVVFSFFSELAIPICINILFLLGTQADRSLAQVLGIVEYVTLANVIYTISMTNIESTMSQEIKGPALIYKLLSPVTPSTDYVISDLCLKGIRCAFFYAPLLLLLILFRGLHILNILGGLFSLLVACVIGYALAFCIGCLSFWLTETWGISAVKNLLLSVFAGALFPLSMLPASIQGLLLLLPFPYLCYFPAAWLLEGTQVNARCLPVGILWCLLLLALAWLLWRAGRKKYESAGA